MPFFRRSGPKQTKEVLHFRTHHHPAINFRDEPPQRLWDKYVVKCDNTATMVAFSVCYQGGKEEGRPPVGIVPFRCFCELRACLAIGNREQIRAGPHSRQLSLCRHRISSDEPAAGKMASTASLGRRMFSSSRRILDNTPNRERVVVAMSGGVDSSVAAHQLQTSHPGADIVGLHVSSFAAASRLNSPCRSSYCLWSVGCYNVLCPVMFLVIRRALIA